MKLENRFFDFLDSPARMEEASEQIYYDVDFEEDRFYETRLPLYSDPVPKDEKERFDFMIRIRESLELQLREQPSLKKSFENSKLQSCQNVESLLQCIEKPLFYCISAEETNSLTDSATRLSMVGVVVNDGPRRRASNIETISKSVLASFLMCDATLQCDINRLKKFLQSTIKAVVGLDAAVVKTCLNTSVQSVLVPLSVLNQREDIWDRINANDDIHIQIESGLYNGIWTTGGKIHSSLFIMLPDQYNQLLRINVDLCFTFEDIVKDIEVYPYTLSTVSSQPPTENKNVLNKNPPSMRRDLGRLAVKGRYPKSVQLMGWGRNETCLLGSHERKTFISAQVLPLWGVLEFVRISKVSCGWYHSALLTDMGLVYTWGSGEGGALGHGDFEDCDVPRLVTAFTDTLLIDIGSGGDLAHSHTAAVSREGKVYCWGSGGTVGSGDTKLRSSPHLIDPTHFEDLQVDSIACGGSFSVALTCDGGMFSWGLWLHGRLGLGATESRRGKTTREVFGASNGRMASSDAPTLSKYRVSPSRIHAENIVKVSCGEAHALALDGLGLLYSWGKGSHGQLGTGQLFNVLEPFQVSESNSPLPKLKLISCGSNHSLALDTLGRMWSWGGLGTACVGHGSSTTTFGFQVRSSFVVTNETIRTYDTSQVQAQVPLDKEQPWRWPAIIESVTEPIEFLCAGGDHSAALSRNGLYVWGAAHARNGEYVDQPRFLKDDRITSMSVESVACGAGYTMVVTSGSFIAEDARLLLSDMFVQHDLELVVGATILKAHKVIVGARSPVLKRLIEMEDKTEFVVTLELPDISLQAAEIILEYIYGDNIFQVLDPMSSLPEEIRAFASEYGMKRLECICARAQADSSNDDEDARNEDIELVSNDELLESSFPDDFEKYINSQQWADIEFKTFDGKKLRAHSAVILSRSNFFRKRLSKAAFSVEMPVQIDAPDTRDCLLRFLKFLYTGKLSCIQDLEIYQDILLAHRYEFHSLRIRCEHLLEVNLDNAIKTVEISLHVESEALFNRAMHFVTSHLAELSEQKNFLHLQQSNRKFAVALLEFAAASSQFKLITTEQSIVQGYSDEDNPEKVIESIIKGQDTKVMGNLVVEDLPWNSLVTLFLLLGAYVFVVSQPQLMPLVPVLNLFSMAVGIGAGVYAMAN